jgi:hypothetical protein
MGKIVRFYQAAGAHAWIHEEDPKNTSEGN